MRSSEHETRPTTSSEASQNGGADSGRQQQAPAKNSVYDFLYHDARRIASFLAQFQTYGVAQSIKATEGAGRSETTKGAVEASGGVPLIAAGKAGIDRSVTNDERDSVEQTFDPLWTNAQRLLDYLDEHELIARNVKEAGIGRFVLASGRLAVVDLSVMRALMSSSIVRRSMLQGEGRTGPNRKERHGQRAAPSEMELGLELIGAYPMTIQATITASDVSVWCSLRDDCFVTAPGNLLLHHGVAIAGNWHMLGIMDAHPDAEFAIEDLMAGLFDGSVLAHAASNMAPAVRLAIGRPAAAYGVTPLMIFRSVSG